MLSSIKASVTAKRKVEGEREGYKKKSYIVVVKSISSILIKKLHDNDDWFMRYFFCFNKLTAQNI